MGYHSLIALGQDIREKIDAALNSPFIGNIEFSDYELEDLKEYVNYFYINKKDIKSNVLFKKVLLVLIVNLSKSWGDDEDDTWFYKKIFSNIFDDNTLTFDSFGLKQFFTSELGRIWLKDNKNNTKRYKQTILFNAFSPKESIESFIKLVVLAYCNKDNAESGFFDETFEENNGPYLRFVEAYAKQILQISDTEEEFVIYGQSYKMSTALRHGFVHDKLAVAKLVSKTIDYFKKFVDKERIYDGTYYSKLVNKYITSPTFTLNLGNSHSKSNIEKVKSINDWYAYYFFKDNHVFIRLPMLRLESKTQYGESIIITVTSDKTGANLLYKNLPIVGNDYNPHINIVELDITSILSKTKENIDFVVNAYHLNGTQIFSTRKSLFRDFIIFESSHEKEIRDNFLDPNEGNYIAILPNDLAKNFSNYDTINDYFLLNSDLHLIDLRPNLGDKISYLDKSVVFTTAKENADIKLVGKKLSDFTFEHVSGNTDVYSNIESILIEPSRDFIEGNNFVLQVYNEDSQPTTAQYPLNFNFKSGGNVLLKCSDYQIFEKSGFFIAKIRRLDIDKTVVTCSFYKNFISLKVKPKHPSKDGISNVDLIINEQIIYSNSIPSTSSKIYVPFNGGKIVFKIPYLKYKLLGIENDEFHYLKVDEPRVIYYKQLIYNPVSLLLDSNYEGISLLNDNGEQFQLINGKFIVKDLEKKIPGRIIETLKIKLEHKEYPIFQIYYKETINENDFTLEYEDGTFKYYIDNFIGERDPKFEILIYDDEGNEYSSGFLDNTSGEFSIDNFEEGYYYYKVFKVAYSNLGYKRGIALIESNEDQVFGNAEIHLFDNKIIKLTKSSNKIRFDNCTIKNIKYFTTYANSIFTGLLRDGPKTFNIYFELRENAISVFTNYEQYNLINYDNKSGLLTDKISENTEEVKSFYYKIEE